MICISGTDGLVKVGNIKGANGIAGTNGTNGTDGSSCFSGSGVPDSALGNNGDSYIDISNGDVYDKANGAWAVKGNIHGAAGKSGTNGKNGEDGQDGSSFLSGAGAPGASLGKDGDAYLDTSTWDVYVNDSGT